MAKNSYPATTAYPPETLMKHLKVTTGVIGGVGFTDDLTPTLGKKIRVLGFNSSEYVSSALTSTGSAVLTFGTAVNNAAKTLITYRAINLGEYVSDSMDTINVVGAVNEVVQLTNVVYAPGDAITRATIFYIEE